MVWSNRALLLALFFTGVAAASGGEASHTHHGAGSHNDQHAGHTQEQECKSPRHDPWFESHTDFFHLENWILACIVLFAVVFELAWHTITHRLESDHRSSASWIATVKEHEFHRSMEEAAEKFSKLSKSLWVTLVERTSGELMVLGILALVLWAMVRLGFFHRIACSLRTRQVVLPHSHEEYLEMVEDVHMHLFLTMVAFISILGVAIAFVQRQLNQWTQNNSAVCSATAETVLKYANAQTLQTNTLDEEAMLALAPQGVKKEDFLYFARSRQLLFNRVNKAMKKQLARNSDEVYYAECSIIHETLQEITTTLNRQPGRPQMHFNQEHLSETMDEWFPFQEYLKLQCHLLLEDMIELKVLTWLYLAVGLLLCANILRETGDLAWLWIVKGVQLVVALIVGLAVPLYMRSSKHERAVSISTASIEQVIANTESISTTIEVGPAQQEAGTEQPEETRRQPEGTHPEGARPEGAQAGGGEDASVEHAEEEAEEGDDTLHHLVFCLHVQDFPMFSIQMFLFYWCYFCVRLIAGKYWWHEHLPYAVTALAMLLLTIPLAGYLVSKIVILMAVTLGRGDMKLKKAHLHWIFSFAEEYLHQLRRHQFGGKTKSSRV